jgi:hypothetical protein
MPFKYATFGMINLMKVGECNISIYFDDTDIDIEIELIFVLNKKQESDKVYCN